MKHFRPSHRWLSFSVADRWRIWNKPKPCDPNDPESQICADTLHEAIIVLNEIERIKETEDRNLETVPDESLE